MVDNIQVSNDEIKIPRNFIQRIIDEDIANNKNDGRVVTRFPPEPNGYLHIGHAKSICINFGLAKSYGGVCHLRFDDTNPEKEDIEYVESIKRDVSWLGFNWGENVFFASDYYEQLYQFAQELIKLGKAYVCNLNAEQTREYRGTLTEAGKPSPNRNLSVEENLDLFARMRAGEFDDGAFVLRAKIDMASPNLNLRDPVLYRIKRSHHFRTGNEWCIYPMYDFTHCLSDAVEGITHSICTLEFEDHRPLYDWILETLKTEHHPQQIEFSRLNLGYTVMSKRKLQELVKENLVSGWDDPRMPTISGMRRRGYPAASIRNFCNLIGVGKSDSRIDYSVLEETVREELNRVAPRAMAVLKPLKLVIENYPEDQEEIFQAKNHPMYPEMGTRDVPFSREIYIEQDDFMEEPMKKFFRLAPGKEVRLRYAYLVTCTSVVKDPESGEIIEVRCTYDPESKGGNAPDGRKVKGTIHWVSARHSISPEVQLFDRLFAVENPDGADGDYRDQINPNSVIKESGCQLEPSLADAPAGTVYQFERIGYFCLDQQLKDQGEDVFIRTVGLRDSWGKSK